MLDSCFRNAPNMAYYWTVLTQTDLAIKALGETIKALRLARGDSQASAASRIGVGVRTWQRMEASEPTDAGGVSMRDYLAALEIYGVDVVSLFSDTARAAADQAGDRMRGRTPKAAAFAFSLKTKDPK